MFCVFIRQLFYHPTRLCAGCLPSHLIRHILKLCLLISGRFRGIVSPFFPMMNPDQEINYKIALALAVSFCLFTLVFATPNDAPGPSWAFVQVARATSWHRLLDWPAAWCSLKILLCSVAMFLTFDALGTILIRLKRKTLAEVFFVSAVLPLVGFLVGDYYLVGKVSEVISEVLRVRPVVSDFRPAQPPARAGSGRTFSGRRRPWRSHPRIFPNLNLAA